MKHLKTIFACLLMAVLSIGQVWATDYELMLTLDLASHAATGTTSTALNNTTLLTFLQTAAPATTDITAASLTGNVYNGKGSGGGDCPQQSLKIGKASGGGSITFTIASTYDDVTKVEITGRGWKTTTAISVNSSDAQSPAVAQSQEYTFPYEISATKTITIDVATSALCATEIKLYKTKSGGGSDPSLSASPATIDFGTVYKDASVEDKAVAVTFENLTGSVSYSGLTSPFSASGSISASGDAITISADASTIGEYEQTLTVQSAGDALSKTVTVTMNVVAAPEPTGTFELFSGDLEEGDYVICSGTTALKNALATNTNYIGYETVTVNNDEIDNPSENLVWHIAQSGEYWTIHNVAANNYAASTGAKNKGQVIADGTDDKALWTASGTSSYEFVNKANTAASVNSNLRYNSGYGFACYSTSTGSALTLYKKQVEGQPKAPTFSIPGGNYETAQNVELSCETDGVTIHYTLDGTTPTNASPVYSTALAISSTTTIKAIAIKNDVSSTVASATYTIIVWQTVADVWDDITTEGPLNAHIYGYVSQTNVGGYANNFYISDNGSTEGNQLYAYRMDMNSFTVAVGDKVKLAGDLTLYNDVKEFKYTSADNCGKVIALEAKGALQTVAVSGTPIKTEYAANEDFDPTGLKVMGTYANGFVGEITEGITWSNDLTGGKVTESTTVHVTATVSEIASSAYDVAVTVAAKTLVSIAATPASKTIYTGEVLPEPTIMATFSEGDPEDVSTFAVYDTESAFDTETLGEQTITVSYTFGGVTKTTTYTVTVIDYANDVDHPYTPEQALYITINAVGSTKATKDIYVQGKVSQLGGSISSGKWGYYISADGTTANQFQIYNGYYLNGANFTNDTKLHLNDEVIVKGKVIYYNSTTPEFATGESQLESLARTPNFAITDVTALEVGATDLAVADLTINVEGEGAITLVSGDETKATIVSNAIHAVAPGTVTITANLAADGIYKAATTEFDVTVIAAQTKYTINFDGNGADGGSAPVIADKAAGVSVDLPANSFTYAGHLFTGWKVFNDDTSEEIEVNAGAFEMPASTVTIQAQWAEISVWATTYTSNVTLSYTGTGETNSQVKINDEDYPAQKVGSSGNDGSVVVTVPYGTHTLHFHAVAWNGKSVTIAASGVENMSESSFTLAADPGFKSSGTYTLENDPVGQYFVMTFTAVTEETQITFSKTAGDDKRFMLYGVNQEGGVLPVLDHIAISGDLDNKSYKAGQALDMTGLTVSATYTLGGTPQTPVDITNDPGLTWTYDPLVENQDEVTVTAHFGDPEQTASKTIEGLTVTTADPKIYVSTLNVDFGSVEVGEAVPANETVTVTLTNVAAATATLDGEGFSITPAALTTSGDITISILANTDAAATYSATLTISDDATENPADSKVINLSFAVIEPVVNEEYQLVSDVASLAAGDQIIIVAENEGDYYTLDGSISSQYFPSTAVSISAGIITAPTTSAIILGKDEDNWTMSMGGQLIGATAAKKASLGNGSASNTWTIAIAENVATITNTTTTYGSLQFNYNGGSNSRFLNYTSAQTAVAIYKKVAPEPPTPSYTTVRTELTAGWYYTMCLNKAVTDVQGGTIWKVLSKAENGLDVILEEVTGTLDAGRPYIFYATASTLEVAYTGDAVGAPVTTGNNGLIGSFSKTLIAQIATNYIIYNNALYFVNSDNVYVGANRAYLDMTGVPDYSNANLAPGRRRVTMAAHGPQTATGIEDLNASEKPMKMMINGQIFILRGEKMYDTTGRLVK